MTKTKIQLISSWKQFAALAFVAAVVILFPHSSHAASLYISPSSGKISADGNITVGVYVNSEGRAVNNAEGTISFPEDTLEVISLNRAGSILSIWVEEPNFSNDSGRISFNGGLPTPGFNGTGGKIFTVTFHAKKSGSALLSFPAASVLANDGLGTNVLSGTGSANFTIDGGTPPAETPPPAPVTPPVTPPSETPPVNSNVPRAPLVSSTTHPDQNSWYNQSTASFRWVLPSGVTSARTKINQEANFTPTVTYSPAISSKSVSDITDGVWYFHVQLRNQAGWGGIAHYRIQVDTTAPKPFDILLQDGGSTSKPVITFAAQDDVSGIDHYDVIIDKGNPIRVTESTYTLDSLASGSHSVEVRAYDHAGNVTTSTKDISILSVSSPIITDYSREVESGAKIDVRGTALANVTIKVYIQRDGLTISSREVKSDAQGNWSSSDKAPSERGAYELWAEAIDASGVKSAPSDKLALTVTLPIFVRIGQLAVDYLTTVVTLIFLVILLCLIIIFLSRKFWLWHKRSSTDVRYIEQSVETAFRALSAKINEQIEYLDGKSGLTKDERRVRDRLQQALGVCESFITKRVKKLSSKSRKGRS